MVGVVHDKSVNMTDIDDNFKLKNIEGKLLLPKVSKHEENVRDHTPTIKIDEVDEKLELSSPNDTPKDIETESSDGNNEKCDTKTPESDKESDHHKKGILKYQRTYSNKHVDFNMDLEFVPFDETKDYTVEIQIVEQMPKKIVSYAALFAQQKKEEEEKLMNEAKEKQKHKIKKRVPKGKTARKHQEHDYRNSAEGNQVTGNIVKKETAENSEMGDETDDEEFSESSCLSDEIEEHSDFNECIKGKTISKAETCNLSEQVATDSRKLSNNLENQQPYTKTGIGDEKHQILSLKEMQPCRAEKEFELLDVQTNYMIQDGYKKNNENCVTASVNTSDQQRLSVPFKKQRSLSLTDLEALTKKLPSTIVQLPNEINLILSREQEKQHSKQHKLIEKKC